MGSSGRHRRVVVETEQEPSSYSVEMERLAEARSALQSARERSGQRSWKQRRRAAAEVESAAHEVQVAAEAAHAAGATWTQIGDALGINRANVASEPRR
ncbi:hypothetical protein TUM20983_45370 [Mycobacterium antarcticum]|nr:MULTISPECIES: hypothetical protein [unclassified Mycolicibacterium]GLP77427.1 hypothetical protein TUM20983_45370 [Mycolicibacterium sp. TUM20983]GLP82169.1 hypothetical protein TUM20984_35890 [Mycolicibacterium sp. TUM20984]